MKRFAMLCACLLLLSAASPAARAQQILILNNDGVDEGFNDPTVVAPVGGNPGTTLGEQRLNCFQYAADIFADILDLQVDVVIRAQFDPLTCNSSSAVLGSAGPSTFVRNFSNAPVSGTWYAVALANNLAGSDLNEGTHEINATFNSSIDNNNNCLNNTNWYLGFDGNEGNDIPLVVVVLHEFAHGFGFLSGVNPSTGALLGSPSNPGPDIYMTFLKDVETEKMWTAMDDAERQASAINDPDLVWTGPLVTAAFPEIPLSAGTKLDGATERVRMHGPNPVVPGSSVSHWTTAASPNLLMEPARSPGLAYDDIDLARQLLEDIGWQLLPEGAPELDVSPTSVNFGHQNIDTGATLPRVVTISNAGTADLNISTVSLVGANPAEFAISNDTGEGIVGPLASRTVQLTFDPASAAARSAALRVLSDDATNPTFDVALSGTGFNPAVGVTSPVYVDFNYAGIENGTQPNPFDTAAEGQAFVTVNGDVIFQAGSTNETGTFNKSMHWSANGGTVRIGAN